MSIVNHPYESTSKLLAKYDKRRVSVGGAYDARMNGFVSIPKTFYFTLRNVSDLLRNKKNPLVYIKERLFAAIYIIYTDARNKRRKTSRG